MERSRGIYKPIRVLFGTAIYETAVSTCWHLKGYKTQIAIMREFLRLQQENRIPPNITAEDMRDLLVQESNKTVREQLWEFKLEDLEETEAKPLLKLVWAVNVNNKMRDVEFQARMLLKFPEATPPEFQRPKLCSLVKSYIELLKQKQQETETSRMHTAEEVVIEVVPRVLQGFWQLPPQPLLNMASQSLSILCTSVTKATLDKISKTLAATENQAIFSRSIRDDVVQSILKKIREQFPLDVLLNSISNITPALLTKIAVVAKERICELFQAHIPRELDGHTPAAQSPSRLEDGLKIIVPVESPATPPVFSEVNASEEPPASPPSLSEVDASEEPPASFPSLSEVDASEEPPASPPSLSEVDASEEPPASPPTFSEVNASQEPPASPPSLSEVDASQEPPASPPTFSEVNASQEPPASLPSLSEVDASEEPPASPPSLSEVDASEEPPASPPSLSEVDASQEPPASPPSLSEVDASEEPPASLPSLSEVDASEEPPASPPSLSEVDASEEPPASPPSLSEVDASQEPPASPPSLSEVDASQEPPASPPSLSEVDASQEPPASLPSLSEVDASEEPPASPPSLSEVDASEEPPAQLLSVCETFVPVSSFSVNSEEIKPKKKKKKEMGFFQKLRRTLCCCFANPTTTD